MWRKISQPGQQYDFKMARFVLIEFAVYAYAAGQAAKAGALWQTLGALTLETEPPL